MQQSRKLTTLQPSSSPHSSFAPQAPTILIPHITKKINTVEKYVNLFPNSPRDYSPTSTPLLSQEDYSPPAIDGRRSQEPEERCCVQYEPIHDKTSEERIEKLAKLERDYSALKQRMEPHRASQFKMSTKAAELKRGSIVDIEDVQKELKSATVKDQGKQYFADLYLLKKGREKIMNSLSGAGRLAMDSNGIEKDGSYEQRLRANEQRFIEDKILHDRSVKKSKMMKGRNLHWNVYYDMLALSAQEKRKVKEICKFSNTYGIS